jgi:hypothetical protein
MQLTKEEQKVVEFDDRCQMVASYLWEGKSVTMTAKQLEWYDVSPHQVIAELSGWLRSEEQEACWEAEHLYGGSRRECTHVVYCTKQGDKYVFKAKVVKVANYV